MKVLVCGATGYVGGFITRALLRDGHDVKVLSRSALAPELAKKCEVFIGQATDVETLTGLCDDCDIVISSLGTRSYDRKPTVEDVDFQANMNIVKLAREASSAKKCHFIFITHLRGRELREKVPKFDARERVVDSITARRLVDAGTVDDANEWSWTVFRVAACFNEMEDLYGWLNAGYAFKVSRKNENDEESSINPIHGADLADVVASSVKSPDSWRNREINVGGPQQFKRSEITELAYEYAGRPHATLAVIPQKAAYFTAKVVSVYSSNLADTMRAYVQTSNYEMLGWPYGTRRLEDLFRDLGSGTPIPTSDDATAIANVHRKKHVAAGADFRYRITVPANASAQNVANANVAEVKTEQQKEDKEEEEVGGKKVEEEEEKEGEDNVSSQMGDVSLDESPSVNVAETTIDTTPTHKLSWSFTTEGYDISFGVVRYLEDGEVDVLVESARRLSHESEEKGSLDLPAGDYTLVWDNGYSRYRSKDMEYTIQVHPITE
eukprot:TRINITY_DN3956_c0_g1_i1.p1 TRINITY_DN3956_c0_g1~~TRINITY_DN3956_c0_g1_i1.p1  ORF type:complete len:495 (+),score=98.03 TRINITY_DN3956_c0_g1_i1:124-1608(+)